MLENMTGGRLRSTIHRVLDHGEERMSAPFFLEPGWDKELCGKSIPGNRSQRIIKSIGE